MHLLRILDTELQDFRKNLQKGRQTERQPESRFQCWFAWKYIRQFSTKTRSKSGFHPGREQKSWVLTWLGLEMKAGVGGIGRSRVETYSLDYSIFFRNYNLVTIWHALTAFLRMLRRIEHATRNTAAASFWRRSFWGGALAWNRFCTKCTQFYKTVLAGISFLESRFWGRLGALWARRGAGVEPSAEQIQDKRASGEVKKVLKNDGTHD